MKNNKKIPLVVFYKKTSPFSNNNSTYKDVHIESNKYNNNKLRKKRFYKEISTI